MATAVLNTWVSVGTHSQYENVSGYGPDTFYFDFQIMLVSQNTSNLTSTVRYRVQKYHTSNNQFYNPGSYNYKIYHDSTQVYSTNVVEAPNDNRWTTTPSTLFTSSDIVINHAADGTKTYNTRFTGMIWDYSFDKTYSVTLPNITVVATNILLELPPSTHWATESIAFNKTPVSSILTPVMLWTNSSPTTSMAANTTITLSDNLSNYRWVIIVWRYSTAPDDIEQRSRMYRVKPFLDGTFNEMMMDMWYHNNNNAGCRSLTYSTSTPNKLVTSAGYFNNNTNNADQIPIMIMGIK